MAGNIITCPHCGIQLRVPIDTRAELQCPECNRTFLYEPPVPARVPVAKAVPAPEHTPAPNTASSGSQLPRMQGCPFLEYSAYENVLPSVPVKRKDICSIEILNTLRGAPADAWDVSEQRDGSVRAWTKQAGGRFSKLALYIAGEGGVAAPENCAGLFEDYKNVKSLRLNGCFDTSQTVNMQQMFAFCERLTELDLSGVQTSSCRNMVGMFRGSGFHTLDLSQFDTSQVTDMNFMFCLDEGLSKVELRSFQTSRVTDMRAMFMGTSYLEEADLSGFDFSHVEQMRGFLCQAGALEEQIDVTQLYLPAYHGSLEDLHEAEEE